MTHTEHEILATLLEVEQAAGRMVSGQPKPDLRPLFARLDALALQLPADDKFLLHRLVSVP